MPNPLNLPEKPEDGICIACLSNPHKEDCDIGKAWQLIEDAKFAIKRMVDVVAENAGIRNEYQDFDEVHDMAAKWLEKYNEVTQ